MKRFLTFEGYQLSFCIQNTEQNTSHYVQTVTKSSLQNLFAAGLSSCIRKPRLCLFTVKQNITNDQKLTCDMTVDMGCCYMWLIPIEHTTYLTTSNISGLGLLTNVVTREHVAQCSLHQRLVPLCVSCRRTFPRQKKPVSHRQLLHYLWVSLDSTKYRYLVMMTKSGVW